jgi:Tfp pilus assembly protein PilF
MPISDSAAEGARLLAQGDAAGAQAAFEGGLAKDPRDVDCLVGLALMKSRALAAAGEIGRAVQALEQAVAQAPDQPALYEDAYRLCLVAGSGRGAVAAATELRRLQPDLPGHVYKLGMAHLLLGEVEKAKGFLEEALRRAPEAWEVKHALAQVLQVMKQHDRAEALLVEASAARPEEAGPANDLAVVYLSRKEHARARQVLGPVLARDPKEPAANLNMALALASEDRARALLHARAALEAGDDEVRQQARRLVEQLASS